MCDVCCAERALWATSCGSKKCMAYQEGAEFSNADAPRIPFEDHPEGKVFRRMAKMIRVAQKKLPKTFRPAPSVLVRAVGKGAEDEPAQYQIKLQGEPWPKTRKRTKDLAGSMAEYGLDVKWQYKPKIVQEWIRGKRACPTEQELRRA